MPTVLGLHAFGHDAGVALVSGGGVWAVSEERLSRRKHDGSFPHQSLAWVLKASGVGDLKGVDLLVYDLLEEAGPRVLQEIKKLGYKRKILACRHHDAHAASAFFASPFEEAAVLTLDAGGTRESESGPGVPAGSHPKNARNFREVQARYSGQGTSLELLKRSLANPPYFLNPGLLYGMASVFLGFGPMGSGKVMGLASFGRPNSAFKTPFFEGDDDDALGWFPEEPREETLFGPPFTDFFPGVTPRRNPSEPLTPLHEDLAFHVQHEAEEVVLTLARRLAEETGSPRLCFSGGYALNVVTNRRLLDETPFQELFVQPAATDAGIPLGCALWGLHQVLREPRQWIMTTAALGPEYGRKEVLAALEATAGIAFREVADVADEAARALAEGKVLGWFQGRSEYGPRALGHRSLLADPRNPTVKGRLDTRIKFREAFRPYAPVVPAEAAAEYFDIPALSPFMLLAAKVREPWRERLPAITHVDGTARVQTVEAKEEPLLHRLLHRFGLHSGVPVLLNTSFNCAGEPLVETPADALEVLLNTDLDAVVIEGFWAEKG